MAKSSIKNLEELLKEYIGSKTIVDVKETPLVELGENYRSYLSRLDLTLKNQENTEEQLHLVAKLVPKSGPFYDIAAIQFSVQTEIYFYEVIVSALQQFQRDHGVADVIDCFPKYYGSRMNLHGKNGEVDDDSVILLENLDTSGFVNVDRYQGYDYEAAKIILKNLASLHAVPLALKLENPKKFEELITSKILVPPPPPPPPPEVAEKEKNKKPGESVLELLRECAGCLPYIDEVEKKLPKGPPPPKDELGPGEQPPDFPMHPPRSEPWATFFHTDMWSNNQMIKIENGKPSRAVILDFQGYMYASPTNDLLFFLFSSIQKSVLEKHFDDLLIYYHKCFMKNLLDLGCDLEPFSYSKFLKEVDVSAKHSCVMWLMFIGAVVFGKKGNSNGMPNFDFSSEDLDEDRKKKIWYIVQECGKRNWLYGEKNILEYIRLVPKSRKNEKIISRIAIVGNSGKND
ncbi:hypothetical protein JTB14_016832 [Gonioctena quinquepunctata]|nr:hypothetical protein JTB14_016832 [Gonioctena quinquepunctata]